MEKNIERYFEKEYFLGDIIGTKVIFHGKKVGTLTDFIINNSSQHPQIISLIVGRPFGDKPYLVPAENLRTMTKKEIVINDINDLKKYEKEPVESAILLKDFILYKKVLDLEGREMAVVYDVKIISVENNLFVSSVDFGKFRYFERMGFIGQFANLINKLTGNTRKKLVSWDFIQPLSSDIDSFNGEIKLNLLKERFEELNPVDLADVLEELDPNERKKVFNKLTSARASSTLEEIDPYYQREIISSLTKEKAVELFDRMTTGQLADVLSALPYNKSQEFFKLLDSLTANNVKTIMNKQEEEIINYTTSKIIKLSPKKTVKEIKQNYSKIAEGKKVVMYLYVVNEEGVLKGLLDIKELLEANDNNELKDIMQKNYISLQQKSTMKEALQVFDRYDFRAIPVIDKKRVLLGVVTYRDVKKIKHTFLE